MPHHSPGEPSPRPHCPSAPRSRAARAALLHFGAAKGTGSAVSPCGQSVGLEGFLWVTRCHLCHPVGALGWAGCIVIPAHRQAQDKLPAMGRKAGTQTEQVNDVALRRHCLLGWAPAFAGVTGWGWSEGWGWNSLRHPPYPVGRGRGWGFGADGWHCHGTVEPPPQTPPRRVGALVPLPRSGFIGNQPPH